MRTIKQQTLITILFWLAIAMKVGIGGVAYYQHTSLQAARSWASHSDDVVVAIRTARKSFTETDLRGRLELVGQGDSLPKESARAAVAGKLFEIKKLVSDNPAQLVNIAAVSEAIKARFKAQDESVAMAKRSLDDSALVIPISQNLNSIMSFNAVEVSFAALESQEYALLRERHADLYAIETTVNNLIYVLLALSIFTSSMLGYFGKRALGRLQYASRQVETTITNNPNEEAMQKELQSLQEYLAENSLTRGI